ncbi:hypothetical protein [Paenibacillus dendritiformis]|uniref:hypothetical protein n=2 Tax=Paenibacillus dendritiformis TaxID=130049 RepID=UPI00143D1D2F|nr:hypothetical protein [Paenibacillus dendritiformis]NKI22458.1 hypothetical protein [Paenibacillus dendritiformis]NRF97498.1 hypothetical protein [Paenibacillus dendritiformis]
MMTLPLHRKWPAEPVLVITKDGRWYIGQITAANKDKITLHGAMTSKNALQKQRRRKGKRAQTSGLLDMLLGARDDGPERGAAEAGPEQRASGAFDGGKLLQGIQLCVGMLQHVIPLMRLFA